MLNPWTTRFLREITCIFFFFITHVGKDTMLFLFLILRLRLWLRLGWVRARLGLSINTVYQMDVNILSLTVYPTLSLVRFPDPLLTNEGGGAAKDYTK